MIEFETEITEVIRRTPDVKSFRFKQNRDDMDFKAGQCFLVTIKVNGEDRTKHFSFSNSPTERGYIEFTKKITGSDFSKALDVMKKGDRARVRMPVGKFICKGEYRRIAFLTGGIGITPIRSICRCIADSGMMIDIVVLYGNDKEEDIVFRKDLDEMGRANRNIKVIYTLTGPDVGETGWTGREGAIDADMIKEEIPDLYGRVFYLSGPAGMVGSLKNILNNQLDIPDVWIRTEKFPGY